MTKRLTKEERKLAYEKLNIPPQDVNTDNFGVWEIPPNKKGIKIYITTE